MYNIKNNKTKNWKRYVCEEPIWFRMFL